ncbi:unnamed protein product, partial [Discosporangium mesarthrocarpum]
ECLGPKYEDYSRALLQSRPANNGGRGGGCGTGRGPLGGNAQLRQVGAGASLGNGSVPGNRSGAGTRTVGTVNLGLGEHVDETRSGKGAEVEAGSDSVAHRHALLLRDLQAIRERVGKQEALPSAYGLDYITSLSPLPDSTPALAPTLTQGHAPGQRQAASARGPRAGASGPGTWGDTTTRRSQFQLLLRQEAEDVDSYSASEAVAATGRMGKGGEGSRRSTGVLGGSGAREGTGRLVQTEDKREGPAQNCVGGTPEATPTEHDGG